MAFIEKTDILSKIRTEELQQITRGDDTIVKFGCDSAIAEMKSYLVAIFDTNAIFSKTGNNRHALLLDFGIDIAIYIIVSRALPGQDLEDRRLRYKRAVDWLKQLKKGEVNSDLPVLQYTDPKMKRGAVGKHIKRDNYF